MTPEDTAKLSTLAGLLLDHRLAQLRKTAETKAKTEAALASLARPFDDRGDLAGASGAIAALAYQRWADARRAEINVALARQTQQWLDARDAAKSAFGKTEALHALADRLTGLQKR
ncbi:MAG: hypothetical protein K9G43_01310 [Rhodobacteraceae bacterium]|nr:hypothetical protein [Paracoccaceae bacterium]